LNDDIARLHAQFKICKDECDKIKFARDLNTIGRHPSIKDGLGFHKGTKDTKCHKAPNFTKEKGKAPMAISSHSFYEKKNNAYLYAKNASHNVSNAHHDACIDHPILHMCHYAVLAPCALNVSSTSSHAHRRSRPRCHAHNVGFHAPRNASQGPFMLYRTYESSYLLHCKNDKNFATNMGPKSKKGKTCIWVPKSYVTNLT
jgi:hypothetical protein